MALCKELKSEDKSPIVHFDKLEELVKEDCDIKHMSTTMKEFMRTIAFEIIKNEAVEYLAK